MAWDFETEPEFQEKLDWADAFVRREVEPLDLAFRDTAAPYDRRNPGVQEDHRSAEGRGEEARPLGLPSGPRARRPWLRPGEARAAARDPRPVDVGAEHLRLPGARLG